MLVRLFGTFFAAALLWGGALAAPGAAHAEPPGEGDDSTYTTVTKRGITTVSDADGWVATFTRDSRTATVRGPERTLTEPNVEETVTHQVYVRLLPTAFDGKVDEGWLESALADTSPDLLAIAFQYVADAAEVYDASGLRVAGDADYGALIDGYRAIGADFNDYLGVSWAYPTYTDSPETEEYGALDCSGYVRMVFGYRGGFPLASPPDGVGLPRISYQQESEAPGRMIIKNRNKQAEVSEELQPGDLVFFDATEDDNDTIDHVGIYLGIDSTGKARFISSRRTPNGPTMGDEAAWSVISGSGYYARAFRSARRL